MVGRGAVGRNGSAENGLVGTACHDRDCLQQARMETSQEPVEAPCKNQLFRAGEMAQWVREGEKVTSHVRSWEDQP